MKQITFLLLLITFISCSTDSDVTDTSITADLTANNSNCAVFFTINASPTTGTPAPGSSSTGYFSLDWDFSGSIMPTGLQVTSTEIEFLVDNVAVDPCNPFGLNPPLDISVAIPNPLNNPIGTYDISIDDIRRKCFRWRFVMEGGGTNNGSCITTTPWTEFTFL